MKRKLTLFSIFVVIAFGMGGCAKQEVKEESDKAESVDKDVIDSENEITEQQEKNLENQVKIYFSNEDASGFETEDVVMEEISADKVWENLIEKGVVPMDVKILSCKETKEEGENALELDLSEKFSTYLNGLGSSGEYITIGSICNTFLDAFDSTTIRITVEGKKLETGHAEYPGYMSKYEL